jgi:hypothetical protein
VTDQCGLFSMPHAHQTSLRLIGITGVPECST